MKAISIFLLAVFSLVIFLFFVNQNNKILRNKDSRNVGSPKFPTQAQKNQPSEQGGILKERDIEDETFVVEFDSDKDRIPTNVEILDKMQLGILEKITESMQLTKSRSAPGSDPVIDSWMGGRRKITFSFQHSPNQGPMKGYLGNQYFFYADFDYSDFSKGYAVSKNTGDIYVWDISE